MDREENEHCASEEALAAVEGKGALTAPSDLRPLPLPAELPDARSGRYYGEHGEVKVRYRRLENEYDEQAPSGLRPFPLPAELRNMIYDLCYGEQGDIKVMRRRTWEWLEKMKEADWEDYEVCLTSIQGNISCSCSCLSSQPNPFPTTFLAHLLVSKQYFDEAVQVWAQRKVFIFSSDLDGAFAAFATGTAAERHLLRSIRTLKVGGYFPSEDRTITSVLSLQYFPRPFSRSTLDFILDYTRDKSIRHDDFLEVAPKLMVDSWLKYRGMRSLTIQWRLLFFISVEHEEGWREEWWFRFYHQVQKLVNDMILQPREQTSATTRPWTFDCALKEAMAARDARHKFMPTPTPTPTVSDTDTIFPAPLEDSEIPSAEAELLRIALTLPLKIC